MNKTTSVASRHHDNKRSLKLGEDSNDNILTPNSCLLTPFHLMFRFRLEPLITIRENVLKECQAELAKAYDARRILEEAMRIVEKQLAEGVATARNLMQPGQTVNVEYLLGLRRQEMYLRANQEDLEHKMQIIDEEIERRRNIVVAANKELKKVEKLKEKRYEEYLEEEKKQETKAMDEIAGNRSGRR